MKEKISNWIFKYIECPIKHFFEGVYNLSTWLPIIWKDRQWDYGFMLQMEHKKLKEVLRWYETHDYGTHFYGWHDYQTLKWALGCLDIILEDDWWSINYPDGYNWLSEGNHDRFYKIKPYVNLRNYKRFLPYVLDSSVKERPNLWKTELREEKAYQLYHKLRQQYMKSWWD